MRSIKYFSAAALMTTLFITPVMAAENLHVSIVNIPSEQGVIRIALFDSAGAYQQSGYTARGAFKAATAKIHGNQAEYTFRNIPDGSYAIKVFQDVDSSGVLKTGAFGKPQEGYGFSNNPAAGFGMPSYDKIQFTVSPQSKEQTISLQQAG